MLIELLELASNNALDYDPESRHRLAKLQGKTMALRIQPIDQVIAVTPQPEGLEYSRSIPDEVDVRLTATLSAMIKISRSGIDDADLKPGELEIAGDPIIGQRFAQIIAELDIDWEGFLAEHMGDTPAHFLTVAAGKARDFADESGVQFKARLKTFLTEDLNLVAAREEVDPFLDEVDRLRADTERLQRRLKRLQTSLL